MANVHITKLASAERQLRSAIRMYFTGEDELAVHTVASAAYRVLADIKAERGMDEAATTFLTSIFYTVREYRKGNLSKKMASDSEFMKWVQEMAEQLPIRADSKFEEVSVTLPRELVGQFWNQRNKVANFLKHADRDSQASISLDEVDNLLLLMQCYCAYMDITREDLGNEGFVFRLFIGANRYEQSSSPSPQEDDLVQMIAGIPEADRLRFCAVCISNLNKT